jgi:4-hydroxy-tetrahydrodipicolinate synthase
MLDQIIGLIPPIVTPFQPDGTINETLIEKDMDFCIKAGVHGLSVGGSTGEGPTLRDEELVSLISIAKKHIKKGQPII